MFHLPANLSSVAAAPLALLGLACGCSTLRPGAAHEAALDMAISATLYSDDSQTIPPEVIERPPGGHDGAPPGMATGESLEAAWAAALALDPGLESLRSESLARSHEVQAARGQRWPSAAVSSIYGVRSDEPSVLLPPLLPGASPTSVPYAPLDQVVLRGQVAVPLYTGHRITSEIEAAEARAQAQEFDFARRLLDLKLGVAESFLGVLRSEQAVAAADSHVRSLAAMAANVQTLAARGQASKQELMAAAAAFSTAEHQATLARQSLDWNRATYNQRLGRPLDAPTHLQPLAALPLNLEIDVLTQRALAQCPERGALRSEAQALGHEADIARSTTLPQVQLLGAYTYAENPFQDPQGLAEAALGVNWNLFDGGTGRHKAAARRHAAMAVSRKCTELESQVQLAVRRAVLDLLAKRERLRATEQSLAAEEEALRAARWKLASGEANGSSLLEVEARRQRALESHFAAHYDALFARLRLLHATGDL